MPFSLDFGTLQQLQQQQQFSLPMVLPENRKTTLWMGDLEPWMDEQYIRQLWFNLNEKVMVKVIRDKVTSASAGYAFVDFGSTASAAAALNAFNGALIPNTHKTFKLNWASGGGLIDRREDRQPEYSIFAGDLSPDCTEPTLLSAFASRYRSCKSAKIMTDPRTGLSRGYGFVRFSDPLEQQRALIEMQGVLICSRPVRVSMATPKHHQQQQATATTAGGGGSSSVSSSSLVQHQQQQQSSSPTTSLSPQSKSPIMQANDPNNTTVFVGGLSAPIREDELRQYFSPFGEIVYTKIPPGKGCGFVQFVSRLSAETAIQQMNGYQIGNSRIRLSWGRSQNDKSAAAAAAAAAAATAAAAAAQAQKQQQQQEQQQLQLSSSSLITNYSPFASVRQQQQQQQPSLYESSYEQQSTVFPSSLLQRTYQSRPSSLDWLMRDDSLFSSTSKLFDNHPVTESTPSSSVVTSTTSPWGSFNHIYAQ